MEKKAEEAKKEKDVERVFLLERNTPKVGEFRYRDITAEKRPENARPVSALELQEFKPSADLKGTFITAVKSKRIPKPETARERPKAWRESPKAVKAPSAVSMRSITDDTSLSTDSLRDAPTRMLDRLGRLLIRSMRNAVGYETPHLSLSIVGGSVLIAGNTPVTKAQAENAAATLRGLSGGAVSTASDRKIRALLNGDYQHQHRLLLVQAAEAERAARAEEKRKADEAERKKAESVGDAESKKKEGAEEAALEAARKKQEEQEAARIAQEKKEAEQTARMDEVLQQFERIRLAIVKGDIVWKPPPGEKAPSKGKLHGEMRILDDVKKTMQAKPRASLPLKDWPVGGVKRDCLACHRAFAIFNEHVAKPLGYRVTTAGTHSKLYPGWLAPDWLIAITGWKGMMTTPALPGWSFDDRELKKTGKKEKIPVEADEGYESESDQEDL